jgi:hypothetical protein
VYGHKPRQLLLVACMEVESALKSVLSCNCAAMPRNTSMKDYAKLARPMRLSEWTVRLARSTERLDLAPFAIWGVGTQQRLPWYRAYNTTKHGREEHLDEATLEHVLDAVAAVYVLLRAQFGVDVDERLRHRPFEVVCQPKWSAEEYYVLSPFEDGPWQSRPLFTRR